MISPLFMLPSLPIIILFAFAAFYLAVDDFGEGVVVFEELGFSRLLFIVTLIIVFTSSLSIILAISTASNQLGL
jgi:hypothetical protein